MSTQPPSPPPSSSPPPSQSSDLLVARLAAVLPRGHNFGLYHISTPPTPCDALFHAPPGRTPDRTYCESHFLAVTIAAEGDEVIVFALEIFVYTTAFASTLFVSKADSSGYLHLLGLPRGAPSPIRAVSAAFVAYLVEQRRRPGIQCVVSLFARAQSQYLFPGSVDNKGKHVLDDRGLVKWWCRVLDGLVGDAETSGNRGFLVVPGLDQYEMRAFLPKGRGQGRWTIGHPLEEISHYVAESAKKEGKAAAPVPPRCLIPRYPDDPKARYVDELDDEAERAGQVQSGQWTSAKSLEQFWEMMAFRQECSSGRLTGFIWVVFGGEPAGGAWPTEALADGVDSTAKASTRTKGRIQPKTRTKSTSTSKSKSKAKTKKRLRGRIVPRTPRAKTTQQHHYLTKRPATTRYYHWPVEGRGRLLVDPVDYKRINELLLQLDFSTLAKSGTSTRRWINEAGVGSDWRVGVEGTADYAVAAVAAGASEQGANDLSGLVKRKRTVSAAEPGPDANGAAGTVNVLSTGLVRKKPKAV